MNSCRKQLSSKATSKIFHNNHKLQKNKVFDRYIMVLLTLLICSIKLLMKELQENTIDQIRTLLRYLSETDLLKNKDILMCLDVIAREYGGEVINNN